MSRRLWTLVPILALALASAATTQSALAAPGETQQTITVTFFHDPSSEAKWAHFTPAPPGDTDTWSIKLRLPCVIGDFTCYAGAQLTNVPSTPPATPPSFDFYSTVTSPSSGGSPRLHIDFSDGGSLELRPLAWVANVWTHEDGSGVDWDNNGGTCGFLYGTTYAIGLTCHATATVTGVIVVTDSAWIAGPYTHYIDNIRYGNALITKPGDTDCRKGGGEGDFEDKDGHQHHASFHGNSCDKNDNQVSDNDNEGRHFESSSVNSASFAVDSDSQTLTMAGTGLDGGLPVAFTLVVIDYGGAAPALYNLTLSDGRMITGPLGVGMVLFD